VSSVHRTAYDPTAHRLREIERVIQARHGVVPATDNADLYLTPVAQCLRRLCEQRVGPKSPTLRERMERWAQRYAPDVDDSVLDDAVATAMRRDVIEKADKIAVRLHVSYEERQRLRLVTIGSYDVNKAGRKRRRAARKRERDRQRMLAKYRAAGKIERAVYLARSLSAARPWEAEGISRRTWERRRKAAQATRDASVSPTEALNAGRHTCDNGTARGRGDAVGPPTKHLGVNAAAHGSDGVVARLHRGRRTCGNGTGERHVAG